MESTKEYLKNKFTILILLIFLTDITILLDIPILRQVLGFLCFTFIPGFLIVSILRLDNSDFFEIVALSVGLGVAFLMFTGLFINNVYYALGYKTPLSTYSLIVSFSIILLLLIFFAYKRNENDFAIPKLNLKNCTGVNMFLIPLIFPFLCIFGAYLMNEMNNNMGTIFMLIAISIYVTLITIFKKKIPSQVYPVAVWAISISLLFMFALRYIYLPASSDTVAEYSNSLLSLKNLYWSIADSRTGVNSCLCVGILPTIYQSLLNIGLIYVYKIIYMLLISFIPVSLYVLFRKYMTNSSAFLSALFFAFQFGFMYYITNTRTAIAMLFFTLFLMTLFSKINELKKKILLIVFMASIIVSHYSTGYITFIMLFIFFLMILVTKNIKSLKIEKPISSIMIVLFFTLIFFWYSQVTEVTFTAGVEFFKETFKTMSEIFIEESRNPQLQRAMGTGIRTIPEIINLTIYYISFIFVVLGSIYSIIRYKNSNFDVEYLLLMFIALVFLALMILLPHISVGYGITRTYQQMLVVLAPFFVIGSNVMFKFLKSPYVILIPLLVLIALLLCNVGGVYQAFGDPHSIIFNSKGYQYDVSFIHEQDMVAGSWLRDNRGIPGRICTDLYSGGSRGSLAMQGIYANTILYKRNKTFYEREVLCGQYIFLRYLDVVNKMVIVGREKSEGLERNSADYSYLFSGKSNIYDNGGSEIWN